MNLRAKLSIAGEPVGRGGGVSSWDEIENKPFSTVDTENGLTIQDNTLMIDTLDHIATIDYVDTKVAEIPQTDLSNYYTKSQTDTAIDNAIGEIDMSGFATQTELQQVADSIPSDYVDTATFNTLQQQVDTAEQDIADIQSDFATKQELADSIPTDVSELNNDAGYITNSALSGYATETYVDSAVDGITTTLETDYATKAELPVATSDLTNDSGFITASALTPYAESADLAAVATSGSYNDLSNKPTIPQPTSVTVTQTLSSGTAIADIDVDGVTTTLYAPQGGGSVEIDNKSIIENGDGELQEAVPVYSENVVSTRNSLQGWTASGRDLYCNNNAYGAYLMNTLSNMGNSYYTIIVNFVYGGNTYQLSGVCNNIGLNQTNNILKGKLKQHFSGFSVMTGTQNARLYTAQYMATNYTVNWVVVKEAEYNATYSDTDIQMTESVPHQLPNDYIAYDGYTIQESSNGELKVADGLMYDNFNVGQGFGKGSLNSYSYPNFKGISLNILNNPDIQAYIGTNGLRSVVGGAFGGANGNQFSQGSVSFTRRSGYNYILETNASNFPSYMFYNNAYAWVGVYYNYANMNNPNPQNQCPYRMIGRFYSGSNFSTDKSDFTIDGLEAILESAEYDSSTSKIIFTFKYDIYPATGIDFIYQGNASRGAKNDKYQKVNSFFLPIDNNTIKRDSDGNIYADVQGGGGSVVGITNTLSTGTAIADITIDGETTTIYAPAGGSGSTDWADITNKPSIGAGAGTNSIVEGLISGDSHNTAGGNCAHAEGYMTVAQSNYSHAEGIGTITGVEAQHVQGKYNISNNTINRKYADVIGNGTSDSNPSNAEATDWDGNKYLAGDVYVGVTNWSTPTLGSAKIPKEADFNWAMANGKVNNFAWDEAQTIVDGGGTDEQSNPEYLGVVGSYVFRYSPNHSSLDSSQDFQGYFWECDYAEAEPNPNYNPGGGGDEPDPGEGGEEEPTEGE